MKRDWKLIRAILREEDTTAWPSDVVLGHQSLLIEEGYIKGDIITSMSDGSLYVRTCPRLQTAEGIRIVEILANADDLSAVLARLDAASVGHVESIVMDMMSKRAKERLETPP